MSLLALAVATAVVTGAAGLLAVRWGRARGQGEDPDDEPVAKPEADAEEPAPEPELPMELRDVVSRGREERWLAGALMAREGGVLRAALFFAPEGAELRAVVAFPRPRREILWLRPAEVEVAGEPPTTLDVDGRTMRRRMRLPVSLERVGQGAPGPGKHGILAEYAAGGRDVAVVLEGAEATVALVGELCAEGEYDVWGGGGED